MVGDALDFWRVLKVDPPQQLLLLAEMKTPGEAMLEFRLTPIGDNQTELQMLSRFLPLGLGGLLYWYFLYPFHEWVFYGMLKSIARSINRPLVNGPARFTPRLTASCAMPSTLAGKSPGDAARR
jgi:hypothetical protein